MPPLCPSTGNQEVGSQNWGATRSLWMKYALPAMVPAALGEAVVQHSPKLARMSESLVVATGLVKRYGSRTAVDGVDLDIRSHQITAVLGPNGAGKTTTVEMCEGFRSPDAGEVRTLGADPTRFSREQRAAVGVMLQSGGVWSMARPAETIAQIASLYRNPVPPTELLDRLFLTPVANTPYRRLSGGEQQRVKLACALVGRPRVLFLDEPTAGLDPHARRAVWEIIAAERDRGAAVVLSTHLMDEAERLADQIVILHHGRVVVSGTPSALTESASDDQIIISAGVAMDLSDLEAVLPVGTAVVEQSRGVFALVAEVSPSLLSTVSAWCADNGLPQHAISIRRQTLEDVFLALTGDGDAR